MAFHAREKKGGGGIQMVTWIMGPLPSVIKSCTKSCKIMCPPVDYQRLVHPEQGTADLLLASPGEAYRKLHGRVRG